MRFNIHTSCRFPSQGFFSLAILICLAGCQTIQFERPQVVTPKDWLVDGYSQSRSRSATVDLQLPLEQVWEYNAAGAFGPGSPLVLRGRVIVATRKGEIHSIDLKTGRKTGYKNFGEGIESTPAIDNGYMYVASALGKRVLASFDLRRGDYVWQTRGTAIESGIVVTPETVIAADVLGNLTAFDRMDGLRIWTRNLGYKVSVQSSLLYFENASEGDDSGAPSAAGTVFVTDDTGTARMVSASTGEEIWSRKLSAPVYEGASSLGSRIAIPTTRGTLEILDAMTGNELWKYQTRNPVVRIGSSAIATDLVVVGASDGIVRAFETQTGNPSWETRLPDVVTAAPLISGQFVFVGTMGRRLYALDRGDGSIAWETVLRGRVKSAMAAVDGGLLVLSEPRYVTYFKTEVREDE